MVTATLTEERASEHIDTLRWANYTKSTNEIIQRQNWKAFVLIWICVEFGESLGLSLSLRGTIDDQIEKSLG